MSAEAGPMLQDEANHRDLLSQQRVNHLGCLMIPKWELQALVERLDANIEVMKFDVELARNPMPNKATSDYGRGFIAGTDTSRANEATCIERYIHGLEVLKQRLVQMLGGEDEPRQGA